MPADGRERASVVVGAVGLVLASATYVAVPGQWSESCHRHFGATHGSLLAAALLGAASIGLGFRSDEALARHRAGIGLLLGFSTLVMVVLIYLTLTARGCGS